jgi:hypothetical protein
MNVNLEKFFGQRKFIFTLVALTVVSFMFGVMKWDADNYVKVITALVFAYLTAQAVVDWKSNKDNPPAG